MVVWYGTNFQQEKGQSNFVFSKRPIFHVSREEGENRDIVPPLPPVLLECFQKATSAFVLFGTNTLDVTFYFEIHNNKFAELISSLSHNWKNEDLVKTDAYQYFLTKTLLLLRAQFYISHIRCVDKVFNPVLAILFDVNRQDMNHLFPYFIIDSQQFVNLPFASPPVTMAQFEFVAYHRLEDVPTQFSRYVNNELLGYYLLKRRVDMFLQSNGIIENGDLAQWPSTEEGAKEVSENAIQRVTDRYGKLFGLQIRLFSQDVPDILQAIVFTYEENTLEVHNRRQEFYDSTKRSKRAILQYYTHTQFKSKYPVLFAVSQYWRLQHWLYLS